MSKSIDAFSIKHGALVSLMIEEDETGQEKVVDLIFHSSRLGDMNATMFEGEELELIDYDNRKLVIVSMPEKLDGQTAGYSLDIQSIKVEAHYSFKDVYTGAIMSIVVGVDGRNRMIFFPQIKENIENKNRIFIAKNQKRDFQNSQSNAVEYALNPAFHPHRHLEGPTLDGQHYITVKTGKMCPDTRGMTIEKVVIEKVQDNFSLQKKDIAMSSTEPETKEEISAKLKKLIDQTKALPGIGDRMAILDDLIARVRQRKTAMILGVDQKKGTHHSLLGSIVQDFGHMAFLGNPGTLKTVFAEIIYWALRSEDIISGPFVKVNGREIIQGYVGQSEVAMRKHIQKALSQNGLLFVDEFHNLNDTNPYGRVAEYGANAARELIAAMEDHRDRWIVILAGYPKEMEAAITQIDKGLKDRLSLIHSFDDYKPQALEDIFHYLIPDGYHLTDDAQVKLRSMIKEGYEYRDETFGNGRVMRNLVNTVLGNLRERLSAEGFYDAVIDNEKNISDADKEKLMTYSRIITAQDLEGCDIYRFQEGDQGSKIGFTSSFNSDQGNKTRLGIVFNRLAYADFLQMGAVANDNDNSVSPEKKEVAHVKERTLKL